MQNILSDWNHIFMTIIFFYLTNGIVHKIKINILYFFNSFCSSTLWIFYLDNVAALLYIHTCFHTLCRSWWLYVDCMFRSLAAGHLLGLCECLMWYMLYTEKNYVVYGCIKNMLSLDKPIVVVVEKVRRRSYRVSKLARRRSWCMDGQKNILLSLSRVVFDSSVKLCVF